jgi:hypothetical protein
LGSRGFGCCPNRLEKLEGSMSLTDLLWLAIAAYWSSHS